MRPRHHLDAALSLSLVAVSDRFPFSDYITLAQSRFELKRRAQNEGPPALLDRFGYEGEHVVQLEFTSASCWSLETGLSQYGVQARTLGELGHGTISEEPPEHCDDTVSLARTFLTRRCLGFLRFLYHRQKSLIFSAASVSCANARSIVSRT